MNSDIENLITSLLGRLKGFVPLWGATAAGEDIAVDCYCRKKPGRNLGELHVRIRTLAPAGQLPPEYAAVEEEMLRELQAHPHPGIAAAAENYHAGVNREPLSGLVLEGIALCCSQPIQKSERSCYAATDDEGVAVFSRIFLDLPCTLTLQSQAREGANEKAEFLPLSNERDALPAEDENWMNELALAASPQREAIEPRTWVWEKIPVIVTMAEDGAGDLYLGVETDDLSLAGVELKLVFSEGVIPISMEEIEDHPGIFRGVKKIQAVYATATLEDVQTSQ